ncbi:MAG: hypothetical protein C0P62_003385 [Bacillota bacterium]|nr:hypothetical protein [Bacillota bacterium]
MKKFRFSLQRVLDVKVLLEEQQQVALAEARAAAEQAAAALARAREERAAAVAEDGAEQYAAPWLRDLAWRRRERLLARERRLAAELAEAREREEEERERLLARHKERLVLEKLADKRRAEYMVQLARWEQAVLDEAALTRRQRLMAGGADEQS